MRTRRTRASAKEEEDAEAAAAVAAVEAVQAVGVTPAALADAAMIVDAAVDQPAAPAAAGNSDAADAAAAEPAPDAGGVPVDPGAGAGESTGVPTSAPQQPADEPAAEMAAVPPPGGQEATIPAAKADDVPPSQQATGTTTVTAATAGAAQASLGNRPPQPASDLLQPAGATPGGDPLQQQAEAATRTAGITPAAETPAPAAVHGQPADIPAADPQAPQSADATPAANGPAAPAAAPAPGAATGEQPAADGTPAPPKRKRRSKWDTTADATPVPAAAAATPPVADTGIPGLANGSAALPGPPDAGTGTPAPALPAGTPGVLPTLPVVTPFVRKRGAARWGPIPGTEPKADAEDAAGTPEGQPPKKKRKSRWETAEDTSMALTKLTPGGVPEQLILPGNIVVRLPSTMTGLPDRSSDPEVAAIQDELEDLNKRLQTGELNIPPEGERSPSPEPIYDRNGIRQNTRDMRVKERMTTRRQELVEEMIKRDPLYRPPADYRPAKKWKKIWIPQKEYPGTNFIGLIIGPRGNTQKRMQRETNTKIAIRGRGSVKEGAARDPRNDYGEDEELHVLITGDKQTDVDTAADMITDLMQPEDEARNEHKRMQLRELAALNGTLKEFEEQPCFLCGETGHRQWECPNTKEEGFKLSEEMQSKVQALYARDIARREGGDVAGAVSQEDEYKAFLSQLGGGAPGAAATPRPGAPGMGGGIKHEGLGFRPRGRPGDELPDSCKLYVGSLPDSVTDDTLRNEFSKYGEVLHAIVLKDMATQMSRGYGFVHMSNEETARAAADGMHGKMIEGRAIVARLRSGAPPPKPVQRPDVPDDAKLYVSNLPSSMNNDLLRSVFAPFGEVYDARAIGSNVGPCRGFGFVTMGTVEAAAAAIKGINGYKMADKMLSVRIAGQPRPPGGPPMGGPPGAGGAPTMRPAYGAPRPPAGPPGAPLPPGTPPGAPPQGAPQPYGAPRPPPGYGAPPPGYGAPPPGYAPYGAPPPYGYPGYGYPPGYGAPPPYGYPPAGYGAPPMGAYPPAYGAPPGTAPPPPGSAPPEQSYGAPPPAPPPEAAAPPAPAAAPAWQPPLPQEASKAPEVKAEPQQQVMSEYERFMAEMGQALP